ncbi:hypothetical protein [Nocardia asteroides]|uniref:hypothetical protein n=1 Tax=Nocardia asteroides TaxID=1824 RepID=UPI001E4FCFF2|nr:hypothetical protein [Nocardia asteroides]UGT61793.1 hypothetical protein LTT61_00070 [Nocardia asteroides]
MVIDPRTGISDLPAFELDPPPPLEQADGAKDEIPGHSPSGGETGPRSVSPDALDADGHVQPAADDAGSP